MREMEPSIPSSSVSMGSSTVKAPQLAIGYPAIEALIQTGDFRLLNASFHEMYDKLEHVSITSKGFAKIGQAKKALDALELSVDLLRQLLQLKHQMASGRVASAPRDGSARAGRKV